MKKANEEWEMLYYSINDTSTIFELENETLYSFYTIATDSADNIENKTNIPDITYTTSVFEEDLYNITIIPNPTESDFTILFISEEVKNISIDLVDLSGIKIKTIFAGFVNIGENIYHVDNNLINGTYFVRFYFKDKSIIRKVIKK